jgi:hypothetical protein
MVTASKATPGGYLGSRSKVPVKDVEEAIARMGLWRKVPGSVVRRIGRHPPTSDAPGGAGHQVSCEPVEAAVEQHGADIDQYPGAGTTRRRITPPAKGPAEVASTQRNVGNGLVGPPGGGDHGSKLGIGGDHDRIVGNGVPATPVLAPLHRH